MKYQTGVIWTTKEGKEIDLADMTDSHLANAIKFLKKRIDEFGDIPFPYLQGEMAQEIAEREYEQAEERLGEMTYTLEEMEKEQERRLTPNNPKKEGGDVDTRKF